MTWIPIWFKANKTLICPLIAPALSYGLFHFIICDKKRQPVSEDKEEMIRWSSTLSDPDNPNFNPFTFTNK